MIRFLRKIIVQTRTDETGTQTARVALEDDFHNFRVEVKARNGIIVGTASEAMRAPYTTCGAGGNQLERLVGQPLTDTAYQVHRMTDPSLQCTHMLDEAGLAIAALSRGDARVEYDIYVEREPDGRFETTLKRNGEILFHWKANGLTIESPAPFAGIGLKSGFAKFALQLEDEALSEAALVARRASVISAGRANDLDSTEHAEPWGNCYSQQKERYLEAKRNKGSTWDFSQTPEKLCSGDIEWVAAA